jgi:hypothetical protein
MALNGSPRPPNQQKALCPSGSQVNSWQSSSLWQSLPWGGGLNVGAGGGALVVGPSFGGSGRFVIVGRGGGKGHESNFPSMGICSLLFILSLVFSISKMT